MEVSLPCFTVFGKLKKRAPLKALESSPSNNYKLNFWTKHENGNVIFINPAVLGNILERKTKTPQSLYVLVMSRTRIESESTLYSCLNVKELLARSMREIWNLSDCNWTRTQNHLVRKRTLNYLAKVFFYELSGSGFESFCSHSPK